MSWRASARVEGPDPEREMARRQLEARSMTASPKGSAERLEYERGWKDGGANAVRSP